MISIPYNGRKCARIETYGKGYRGFVEVMVTISGHSNCAQTGQMGSNKLHFQEGHPACAHDFNEDRQRNFGGVRTSVEHAFSIENTIEI